MEERNNSGSVKTWLKNKINGKHADTSSPLLVRQSSASGSPRLTTNRSTDEETEGSFNHGYIALKPSPVRTRPVKRSNTTGTSPRPSTVVISRRQRVRESTDGHGKQSVVGSNENYAGDLFVGEEGLVSLQRIRNFSTKDGSLVNRGDSFRIKKGTRTLKNGKGESPRPGPSRNENQVSVESAQQVKKEMVKYEIIVLGSSGVGKSTLINQMMTSVHLAADDSYGQHMTGCHTEVVVKVDQFEIVLKFLNSSDALHQQQQQQQQQHQQHQQQQQANSRPKSFSNNISSEADLELIKNSQSMASGFLVVYSVTDQSSFRHAQTCLHELRPDKRRNLVILVANKNDLVRNRVISEEDGMKLATKKQCKYIDLSALLDHKVDDLLVGVARQIYLRQTPPPTVPRPRVYFDEEGNPVPDDYEVDDSSDDDQYENRAHVAALEANSSSATPRLNQRFAFLKPLFGQAQNRMRLNPGKFQSRVGSLVLGLFKKKHKESDKNLSSAFSGHTYALTSIFPATVGSLKNRCDDLMSP